MTDHRASTQERPECPATAGDPVFEGVYGLHLTRHRPAAVGLSRASAVLSPWPGSCSGCGATAPGSGLWLLVMASAFGLAAALDHNLCASPAIAPCNCSGCGLPVGTGP